MNARIFASCLVLTALLCTPFSNVLTSKAQEPKALTEKKSSASMIKDLPPSSKRYALLIGVSDYKSSDITSLPSAEKDAEALSEILIKYLGFPKENVIVLATNRPRDFQPEGYTIYQYIARIAHLAEKDGLFLLAFSGHGYELDGQAFFLGSDARIENNIKVLKKTCVSWADMNELIEDADVGQMIVLLDACRNNPMQAKGENRQNQITQVYERGLLKHKTLNQEKAFIKILSTQKGEFAYEDPANNLGFFTSVFVDAIKGEAADDNGAVTLGRLRRYLEEKLPLYAKLKGKDQKPVIETSAYDEENLILSINPAKKKLEVPKLETKVEPMVEKTDEKPVENPALTELNEWIRTRRSQQVEAYKTFLQKYPQGNFSEEAKARIREIEYTAIENEDWERIKNSQRVEDYKGHLNKHPNGSHAVEASEKIREFEASATKVKIKELEESLKSSTKAEPTLKNSANTSISSSASETADALHATKGTDLLGKRKFVQAETEFREALKLNPSNADYYGKLGVALYSQGKFKDAETAYKKAIDLDPYNADWLFNLGLSLQQRQKYADAEASFRKALKLKPSAADCHVSLCTVLALQGEAGKILEAETECKAAIKLDPNNAFYHSLLGNVFILQKRYNQAETEYQKAIQIAPSDTRYKEKLKELRTLMNR